MVDPNNHRPGDRFVAQIDSKNVVLVACLNLYGRWTVSVFDNAHSAYLVEMHEEETLEGAKKYAEGYVHGRYGEQPNSCSWAAHPKD